METAILWTGAITFSIVTTGLATTTRKAHRATRTAKRLHDHEGRFAEIVTMLKAQRGLLAIATTISGATNLALITTAIRAALQ